MATYEDMADKVADANGIPRSLFRALIQQESGWNAYAVGTKGEIGLTQLMPTTAQELGVNAWDALDNLKGGAAYLKAQFQKFGDWAKALAAYNGGPGGVDKPAAKEYATDVLATQKELQKENPKLDQAPSAPAQEQDAWHGSVGEQIWNWIKNTVTGSDDPTPIGKKPSPETADPNNPSLPMPTKEATESYGAAVATVGKYAGASVLVVVAIGIGMYVLATRGKDVAVGTAKKTLA